MRIRLTSRALLGCAIGLFLTTGVGMLVFACYGMAQQPAEPKLPEGLRHVPGDALGFVHFRAGDFLKSEFGGQLLTELRKDREASRGLKEMEQFLGIALADIESVTLLMLSPPTREQFGPWDGPRGRPYNGPFGPRPVYKDRDKRMDFKDMRFDKDKVPFEDKDKDKGRFEDKKAVDKALQVSVQHEVHQEFPGMDPREVVEFMAMSGPLVMVTSTKPLDRRKILAAQVFKNRHGDFHGPGRNPTPSVLFLSDRTLLVGAAWEVARYSEQMARNPGPKTRPMQSALALGATPHLIVAGGHVPIEIRRMYLSPFVFMAESEMRVLAALSPLLPTEAAVAIDLGKNLDVAMHFTAPTEASAANALQAAKNLRVLGELAIEKSNDAGEPGGWKLDLERSLKKALAEAVIEQKGTLVRAQVKVELSPQLLKHFAKDIVGTLRTKGDRTVSVNNLKQIGIALHTHHDLYKNFPPAGISAINDPNGKPLLSWRVAILPFIEQEQLYRQFDLTQPWDHPTNKKLIERMPSTYELPGGDAKEGMTHYRVLVGPGTLFEPRKGPGGRMIGLRLQEVLDGTSNTIMVVEAREPTIWTRPDDLPYDPKAPLPKFGLTPDGFNVLMGDASVRFIRGTMSERTLRNAITRDDGNPLGDDWFDK